MTNIVSLLASAATLLAIGVLIGSGLHTRGIDRRYRDVSQLVRELNDQQDAIPKSAYPREHRGESPLKQHGMALPLLNRNGPGRAAEAQRPRRYDPQSGHGPGRSERQAEWAG